MKSLKLFLMSCLIALPFYSAYGGENDVIIYMEVYDTVTEKYASQAYYFDGEYSECLDVAKWREETYTHDNTVVTATCHREI